MYASGSSSKPLKRGKACLTCRFLKIKCDGVRPICGPCERHPKDDPCEYADGPGRSRTKQLEDTVSRLEARLREYENPNETPAVTLSNPYETLENDTTLRVNLPLQPAGRYPSEGHSYSPSSPYSTSSPVASSSTTPLPSAVATARLSSTTPPYDNDLAIRNLLDAFFTQASSFGFFLHVSRFYSAALQPSSFGFPTRPCSSLLNTVLLWGLHLSRSAGRSPTREHSSTQSQKSQEHAFLLRALRDTAVELVSLPQPMTPEHHRLLSLQTIQAEVLLSYYFFRIANVTEARRHASSAASLVFSFGLHRTWSSTSRSTSTTPDVVEEGERINGFWAVFTLYRNLAVALDSPSEVCGVFDAPGVQIDTPWPLDIENYKEGVLPDPGSSTIWNYLNHVQTRNDSTYSTHTLLTKASILLHQATFLEGQYHPEMSGRDSQSFSAAFQSLSHLIENLRVQLPPLSNASSPPDPSNPTTRLLFLAHSMLHGAIIKLRTLFSYSDPSSRQMCVAAARAMIVAGGTNIQEFQCVNPIMGTLWMLACQVLTEELSRLRSIRNSSSTYSSQAGTEESEQDIYSLLQLVLGAMSYFSTESAMMSKCLLVIRRRIFDEPATSYARSGPRPSERVALDRSSFGPKRPDVVFAQSLRNNPTSSNGCPLRQNNTTDMEYEDGEQQCPGDSYPHSSGLVGYSTDWI